MLTFMLIFVFEQFMFHKWRIYEYYEAREFDVGIYDKSNIPMTVHNKKLYLLYRTDMNMSDFARFIEVDVHDAIRDNTLLDEADKSLLNFTDSTSLTKVQLRRYLAKYVPERIMWTSIDPVHNDTRERDTHRYYWASKMAKDFTILTGKDSFTYGEMNKFFEDKMIHNYLNELILEAIDIFETVVIEKAGIKEAFFDEHFPYHIRFIPWYRKAKRMSKFIGMDQIYFQFADAVNTNTTRFFSEDLTNYEDFRADSLHYSPILDPKKNPDWGKVSYFSSPGDNFLFFETSLDHIDMDR